MSDAIEQAKQLVQDAYYDERGMQDTMRADAATWAAIAQAEQLKRIADMMEGYLAIYADPAVFSGSDQHGR